MRLPLSLTSTVRDAIWTARSGLLRALLGRVGPNRAGESGASDSGSGSAEGPSPGRDVDSAPGRDPDPGATVAPSDGTESDGEPTVLGVTAHRPHELREPLARVDAPTETVAVDPDGGFLERNLAALRETRRAIRACDPDVVVYDCRELLGTLVTLVCLRYGVPTIFRFKGNHWQGLTETYRPERGDGLPQWCRYQASRLVDEFNYAAATGYVAVSEELREVVTARTGCSPECVEVVHVPVDTERPAGNPDRARDRYDVREGTVVLTVTNLTYRAKYDGVETVLRGIEPVLADRDDAAYVVAGGGPYHQDLRTLVDSVDDPAVRERVYAPGYVDGVDDLYALADVFVYVSYLDGYPNAVLEAQQAGLPVVANPDFGMVEQVEDGRTGRLLDAPHPDPAAVSAAVEGLLADPDERARLGRNAREQVRAANDPGVIGQRLYAALSRILRARDR